MAVNNEIGTVQPLKEIGALCKEKGVILHTLFALAREHRRRDRLYFRNGRKLM
ncbi:MAG: aminotransferase class V-fold PLP-dependent enzyme [Clostridia bacterium]|nr:aminotransferase class V-fold PLP-dependent enzyme [Clostridia bacterium]